MNKIEKQSRKGLCPEKGTALGYRPEKVLQAVRLLAEMGFDIRDLDRNYIFIDQPWSFVVVVDPEMSGEVLIQIHIMMDRGAMVSIMDRISEGTSELGMDVFLDDFYEFVFNEDGFKGYAFGKDACKSAGYPLH